jgi:hypothetical protein
MSMPHRRSNLSAEELASRFARGMGTGVESNYQPWQTSENTTTVSHSGKGYTSPKINRLMHHLSEVEDALAYGALRIPDVEDLRENFPLSMSLTRRICEQANLKHARSTGTGRPEVPYVTDLLVSKKSPPKRIAFIGKLRKELSDSAEYKALFVQHVYWSLHNVPVYIATEMQFPDGTLKSLAFLAPQKDEAVPSAEQKNAFLSLAEPANWSRELIVVVREISALMGIAPFTPPREGHRRCHWLR